MEKMIFLATKAMFKFLGLPGKEYLINQVVQKIQPILAPLLEQKETNKMRLSEVTVKLFSPDKKLKEISDLLGDTLTRHNYDDYETDGTNLKNLDVSIKAIKKYYNNLKPPRTN